MGLTEDRARFRAAAGAAGFDTYELVHEGTGPDGLALATDVAVAGPQSSAPALIVLTGVHGIEGPIGSEILAEALALRVLRPLPNIRLVLVHALNPFGYAWGRRADRTNVDVNRNFIDYAQLPDNPGYRALRRCLVVESASEATLEASHEALLAFAARHGHDALVAAVTRGQYHDPEGLYYGGTAPSWSRRAFEAILARELDRAPSAVLVDIHTGLGDYGEIELITDYPENDAIFALGQRWLGGRLTSTVAGTAVCGPIDGTIDLAFLRAMAPRPTLAMVAEIGTLPGDQVLKATIAEHWLHRCGERDSDAGRAIRARFAGAFDPPDPAWRRRAADGALEVLARLVAALPRGLV